MISKHFLPGPSFLDLVAVSHDAAAAPGDE